jgi:hypothetical protein
VVVVVAEAIVVIVVVTAIVVVHYVQFLKVTLCVTLTYLFLLCICAVSVIGHLAVNVAHKNKEFN